MAVKPETALDGIKKKVRDAVVIFEHKEGSKLVDLKDIPTLVRYLGPNPTGVQINMIIEQLTTLCGETDITHIPLEHIETVVSNFLMQQEGALFRDEYHTLIRAFRAFDPEGKGYIVADQFRNILATKGEPMTEDEMYKMLDFAADESGKIFYEDYAQQLCTDGRSI